MGGYFWLDLNSQRDFGQTLSLSRGRWVHRSKVGYIERGKGRKEEEEEEEEEEGLSLSLSPMGREGHEIMASVAINSFLPCMGHRSSSTQSKLENYSRTSNTTYC